MVGAPIRYVLPVEVWQRDVFEHRLVRQRVRGLKDKAKTGVAQFGELLGRESIEFAPIEQYRARGRGIQAAEQIQQGRFPRSRGPGQDHQFTSLHRQ